MRSTLAGQWEAGFSAYAPCTAAWRQPRHPVLRIASGNTRKVEKRLELTLSGDWATNEAKMLSEGVGIRVA
jgi:hypothetical protein